MLSRCKLLLCAGILAGVCVMDAQAIEREAEIQAIKQWRAERVSELTSETGWLTLIGLFWLDEGANSFGRDKRNKIVLNHAALAENAGVFTVSGKHVRFVANTGSGITQMGQAVTSVELKSSAGGAEPTVLSSGPLQFFLIERSGKLAVRIRDTQSPRRTKFGGIDYFDIDPSWHLDARFEPYTPSRRMKIMTVLGTETEMDCPGAIVFTKGSQEWRLDALLDSPQATELFVMFSDGTTGHETYGAGRFMYIDPPVNGAVTVDFNKAHNPPCAFNEFATCPLPPKQNRLNLRVDAGEKAYRATH